MEKLVVYLLSIYFQSLMLSNKDSWSVRQISLKLKSCT